MDIDYIVSNLIVFVYGDDFYGIGNVICWWYFIKFLEEIWCKGLCRIDGWCV